MKRKRTVKTRSTRDEVSKAVARRAVRAVTKRRYSADHFIEKFLRIPASRWSWWKDIEIGKKYVMRTALAWCALEESSEEANALTELFAKHFDKYFGGLSSISLINRWSHSAVKVGISPRIANRGPRARVIAALKMIKEHEG